MKKHTKRMKMQINKMTLNKNKLKIHLEINKMKKQKNKIDPSESE